jgi:hypothetical protein
MESVPAGAGIAFLILPLQAALAAFYHHKVKQRNEFKAFSAGPLVTSPIVHNSTLLFLLFVQAICFDKKSEIL